MNKSGDVVTTVSIVEVFDRLRVCAEELYYHLNFTCLVGRRLGHDSVFLFRVGR